MYKVIDREETQSFYVIKNGNTYGKGSTLKEARDSLEGTVKIKVLHHF